MSRRFFANTFYVCVHAGLCTSLALFAFGEEKKSIETQGQYDPAPAMAIISGSELPNPQLSQESETYCEYCGGASEVSVTWDHVD